jgi:hypothetical protein
MLRRARTDPGEHERNHGTHGALIMQGKSLERVETPDCSGTRTRDIRNRRWGEIEEWQMAQDVH